MQAVGFIECLRVNCNRPGPFIIVVPLSTIRHWQKELDERSSANTVVLHGTTEDRDTFVGSEFTELGGKTWLTHFDVMITTYETVQQELSFLKQIRWTGMVVDEAHRLKNSVTQVRSSLKDLDVDFTVLLTGTPIQNNIPELYSLLNFMHAEEFKDREKFLAQFGTISTDEQVKGLQEILREYNTPL
jgi:SNF2 family DNA or RNA helicase